MNDKHESDGNSDPDFSVEEEVRGAILAYVQAVEKTQGRNLSHRTKLHLGLPEACSLEEELKAAECRILGIAAQSDRSRTLLLLIVLDETVSPLIRDRILDLLNSGEA